jgi:glycosyltransferase involved in cell wall biosynthesis
VCCQGHSPFRQGSAGRVSQAGKIVSHDVDHDLVMDVQVVVCHDVAHPLHGGLVESRHGPERVGGDSLSLLTDLFEALDDGIHRHAVVGPPVTCALAARLVRPTLQRWDRWAARRPDILVANSATVRERIRRLWKRDAEVIYPPVDVAGIPLSTRDDGYLLVVARMLAYRRIDLAVAASTALGRDLVVVGDGPERARLGKLAGPTIRFLGRVDRPTLVDLFGRCHAYLVPGVEDFGIAPVEAMAAGKPVIAFRAGGATETVVEGRTGIFFERQEVAALAEAIERLDGLVFTPATIRARAEEFDSTVFRRAWRELLARLGVDPSLYLAG